MKSNGFGSFEQTIILHVPKEHAERFALKLGAKSFKEAGDPARTYFAWKRGTTRPGNDEDVVFDLYIMFNDAEHKMGWEIDWDASEF